MRPKFSKSFQQFDVVFDDKGEMDDATYIHPWKKHISEPNVIFKDILEYNGYHMTYSGKTRFDFKSKTTNRTYVMFITDFDDIITHNLMNNKIIDGHFVFRKAGSQQGIRFVKM